MTWRNLCYSAKIKFANPILYFIYEQLEIKKKKKKRLKKTSEKNTFGSHWIGLVLRNTSESVKTWKRSYPES